METDQIISPREAKRTKFMSERSMSNTSLEEVDFLRTEDHVEDNKDNMDSMKLIEAINKAKGVTLDLSQSPVEIILGAGIDTMEEIIKYLEEKNYADEEIMGKIRSQYKELQAEKSKGDQEVTARFDHLEVDQEATIRKVMFSANDYFVQNRLRLNESSFFNNTKSIMLENGDVVGFHKSATYDKKSNFEVVVAESKIDGNHYLCANMTEPSFTSTIFTVTRSTKHLERGYLTRCQAFNGMKRIVKFLEQKLMENWVNLKISGASKAWMFCDNGTEFVPAKLREVKVSPNDELEYFRVYMLEIIA